MGPHHRDERGICAKEGESVPIVKGGKRGGKGIYLRTAEKGVYPTVKVITDGTGILCGKEGQKEENGPGL